MFASSSVVRKAGCTSMEIEINLGVVSKALFYFRKASIYTEVPLAMTRRHEKSNSDIFSAKNWTRQPEDDTPPWRQKET